MKKLSAALLTILMIFLVGCSGNNEVDTPQKEDSTGFVEIELEQVYLENAFSIKTKGELVMFLSNFYVDKDLNPTQPTGDDDIAELTDTTYILIYNAKENKLLTKKIVEDCPFSDIWGCEFGDDDTIVLYNDYEKKNAIYDMDINLLETTDRVKNDFKAEAEKSPFYCESATTVNPGYAQCEGAGNSNYVYFLSEPETVYYRETEMTMSICDCLEERCLLLNESFPIDNSELIFSVDDYKNGKELCSASLRADAENYDSITHYLNAIGDAFACTIVNYYNSTSPDESNIYKLYFWNYIDDNESKALNIEQMSFDEFKSDCEKTISDINDKYNISIHINEDYDMIADMVNTDGSVPYITLVQGLTKLQSFLDSLPEGMVEELYSGFDNGASDNDGIRIDVVSSITYENCNAFTMANKNPMELCFSFNTLETCTIAHEFMHLMDFRIDNYVTASDDYDLGLFDEWYQFNKELENDNWEDEDAYRYKFDEQHFISEYGSKDSDEDRAELFAYLYCDAKNDASRLEAEPLKEKADCLCRLIRESFPSCKNADNLPWEESLK